MSENKYSVALGLYGKYLLRSPSGFVLGEYGIRSNAEHQADMLQTAYDAGRASALSERDGEAAEELSTRISDVRSEVPPSVRGLNDTLRTTLARLKEMKK